MNCPVNVALTLNLVWSVGLVAVECILCSKYVPDGVAVCAGIDVAGAIATGEGLGDVLVGEDVL